MSGGGYVVGVDLGGTKIRAAVAGATGPVLAQSRVATAAAGDGLIEQLRAVVADICDDAGIDASTVEATALGGAGVPHAEHGTLTRAPNLAEVQQIPLVAGLEAALGHPVVLDNDVNLAALGELHHGAGTLQTDFAVISVGTGIGMGIVSDGRLIRGANGGAGEIGFLPFGADPLDDRHHVHGALEEVASGEGLVRAFAAATGERISSEEIFSRAERGDASAAQALDELARWIGAAVAAAHAVLDPGIIILNGGIGSRRVLLHPIRRWAVRHGAKDVRIEISTLGEQAPLLGGIRLAREAAAANQEGLAS